MAVTSVSGVPLQFEAGNTVNMTLSWPDYSAATWTLAFALSRPGCESVSVAGSASGTSFTVALSSSITGDMTPGLWTWVAYVTSDGERTTAEAGSVNVLADLAKPPVKSAARLALEAIDAAIAKVAASPYASVSFNGQTYTRATLSQLNAQRTDLAAAVYNEERADRIARGGKDNSRIASSFAYLP